jgi:hypothetical protein
MKPGPKRTLRDSRWLNLRTPLLWLALVMLKHTAALAAAAGALALAGCGDDDSADKEAAERAARDFAAADGPQACDLMTERALEDVYGADDSQNGYYNCVDRSDRFQGEEIDIEETERGDDDRITVTATTPDDDRQFKVTLDETGGEWLVDRIIEE